MSDDATKLQKQTLVAQIDVSEQVFEAVKRRINESIAKSEEKALEESLSKFGFVKQGTCKATWILTGRPNYRLKLLACSNCGISWHLEPDREPNYCPNCGAKVVSE